MEEYSEAFTYKSGEMIYPNNFKKHITQEGIAKTKV